MVDPGQYPFEDHWFPLRDGYIHYVDEGDGPVVLLLHGNPTWSYVYRDVVKELQGSCRVIAPDYPGFGMSMAPSGYGFTPQEHAGAISEMVGKLGLRDLVLVVQDWGGPIGMGYATQNPANLRGLVVMNTWAWPASRKMILFSLVMGGWPIGYWLQTRRNYFAASMLPSGIRHSERVTEAFRRAYTDPFPTPNSRRPTWIFPKAIRKSRAWLASLESGLPLLADLPAQILWGTYDDPGFSVHEMTRWQRYLRLQETETLADASHSVQEDRPDRVAASILRVLARSSPKE